MADDTAAQDASSILLAILGIIAFVQLLVYSIYECMSKLTRPASTVHFTRTSVALCGVMASLFLLCMTDSAAFGFGLDSTFVVLLGQLAWSFIISLYAYFLVVVVNPILGKSAIQILVQDVATVTAAVALFQIPLLLVWGAVPDKAYLIISSTRLGVHLLAVGSSVAYIWLFVRRRSHQLRINRGNEPALCRYGLATTAAFSTAVVMSVVNEQLLPSDYWTIASRLLLNCTTASMVGLKFAYNRGLMRHVNGKIVFSRGYTVTNPYEAEMLTKVQKSTMGIGALA